MQALKVDISNCIHLRSPPAEFARRVKSELTFDNPDYTNAVRHGRSTRGVPRKIRTYEEQNGDVWLPRGFWQQFNELARSEGYGVDCIDKTASFEPRFPPRSPTMWDYQEPWVRGLLSHDQGIGIAPPGSGKTVMGLEVYARLGQPCLWITHTGRLVRQTRKKAEEMLGIETGIIGKGKTQLEHFTVGMVQTLVRRDLSEYRKKFGLIIVDECHHVPASTFSKVVSALDARYRYGLTATPYRDDQLEKLMFHILGPELAYLDKETLRAAGKLMTPTIIRRPTAFSFPYNPRSRKHNYKALSDTLAGDKTRNCQISTDVLIESSLDKKNICIVLVGRIAHGQALFDLLDPILPGIGFVHSEMSFKKSDEILDNFEAGEVRVLIATYRMLAEGFDYQPANRLFLTAPYKGRTLIEQACGRIERTFPGKTDACVFDYVDKGVGVLNRQAEIRLDIYEANNTPVVTIT